MIWPVPVLVIVSRIPAHAAGFGWERDLPPWLLALFALLALGAAVAAYFDQRKSTAALAAQVKDQGEANKLQGDVLQAQFTALLRQQAEHVASDPRAYDGPVPGVQNGSGEPVHMRVVTNNSQRPIRNVVVRMQAQQNGGPAAEPHATCLTGELTKEMHPRGDTVQLVEVNRLKDGGTERPDIPLKRAGDERAFVFALCEATHQGIFTLRFNDDAGLHWEIDNDLHLRPLDNRDDW
jgi:hypothetical protein